MNRSVAIVLMAAALGFGSAAPAAAQSYHVVERYKLGGNGGWDYLALDGATNRLFIGRDDRIMVVDPAAGKVVGEIGGLVRAHGIAFDGVTGRGFATSGGDATVVIFDLATLEVLGRTKVDEDDDAILLDPATRHVFTFNGDAHTASVLDPASGKRIGTVDLGAKPEFGVADGHGKLYVNLESSSEIAEIDAAGMKVTRRWPLAPCEAPTGLAIDVEHRVLFSVCRNRVMAVSDAAAGKVVANVAIGPGADAARYDARASLAFASTGGDGAISVIREQSPSKFDVVQTVETQVGARTMELDPRTHRLYTVSAEFGTPPASAPGVRRRPPVVPGSFTLLVLDP
jgi:DNA-binding beta-propeller fold protein YncE